MNDKQDTTGDDTPRDARRAEYDAKRDMLDAAKQERADAAYDDVGRRKAQARAVALMRADLDTFICTINKFDPEILDGFDEQETTED